MILSARAIASEIADSDAGEFLPSHCVNFRAARIQAAIRITRFLPSSTTMSVAYSLFVRYNYIRLLISDFGNLRSRFYPVLWGDCFGWIFLIFDCSRRQRTHLRNISLVTDGGSQKKRLGACWFTSLQGAAFYSLDVCFAILLLSSETRGSPAGVGFTVVLRTISDAVSLFPYRR